MFTRTQKRTARGPLLLVVVTAALWFSACGSGTGTATTSTETTPATDPVATTAEPTTTVDSTTEPAPSTTEEPPTTPAPTTLAPTTTAEPEPDLVSVNVYWLRETSIAVGGREVDATSAPAEAIEALFEGPNTLESELDMMSVIPQGTQLLELAIDGGVATIDLSSEFEASGMGTAGENGLIAQIVYTLTQFPSVDSVDIKIDGEARDAILSHGFEATGLTRAGFDESVAPAIVVESPYPGQVVESPLTVKGFSRTFEASVVYVTVIPPSGEIVDEGGATASQPDVHLFGPFEFTTEFETDVAGFGAIIVFEESAKDGSQINVYEVPVLME